MKGKTLAIVLCAVVVLAGIGAKLGYDWWDNNTYITIADEKLRRDVIALDYSGQPVPEIGKLKELKGLETLDLRNTGLTAAQYEELKAALPDCRILWSVPFQNGYLDMETQSLSLTNLSEQDLKDLAYLENLQSVEVSGFLGYETVETLIASRPDLEVHYTVEMGEGAYSYLAAELELENADPYLLSAALPYMKNLTRVSFTGQVPDNDQIYEWMVAYPEVTFIWDFDVCGFRTNSLATELILNDIAMDSVEEVESSFKYFYDLQKVEMCRCGISSEELDALWKRHPEIRIIWEVKVGKCTLRTDVTTFMPYKFGYKGDGNRVLRDDDMAEMKYCVDIICMDMGHMEISDYTFLTYMPNMQYLILADTMGTDFSALASLKELKYLELFMLPFDHAEVLVGLTKLEDLNVGTTKLNNIEPLKQMTWLKHLWLPANKGVTGAEKRALVAALPNTVVEYRGTGSTGYGWREIPNYYAMRDLLGMPYSKGK